MKIYELMIEAWEVWTLGAKRRKLIARVWNKFNSDKEIERATKSQKPRIGITSLKSGNFPRKSHCKNVARTTDFATGNIPMKN
jgi:hypothetical protein